MVAVAAVALALGVWEAMRIAQLREAYTQKASLHRSDAGHRLRENPFIEALLRAEWTPHPELAPKEDSEHVGSRPEG